MNYLEEVLRFLGQITFQTGTIELTSVVSSGDAVSAQISFAARHAVLRISYSSLGQFEFLPDRSLWSRHNATRVEEIGVDNQAALDCLREGLQPNLSWLTDALRYIRSRRADLNEALRQLRELRNPWTFLVIPGASSFAGTFGPFRLGDSIAFPRFTGHVALKNVAINLPVSHVGFELSILAGRGSGNLDVYLGDERRDAAGQIISPHLSLQDPEFDFAAEAVLSLVPDGNSVLVQSVDVAIRSASFRSRRTTGLADVDQPSDPVNPNLMQVEIVNMALGIHDLISHGAGFQPSGTRAVELHGGPVRLEATELIGSKSAPLLLGSDQELRPLDDEAIRIKLRDLSLQLTVATAPKPDGSGGWQVQTRGAIEIPEVAIEPVHVHLADVIMSEFQGSVSVPRISFGPFHREIEIIAVQVKAAKAQIALGDEQPAEGAAPAVAADQLSLDSVEIQLSARILNLREPDPASVAKLSSFHVESLHLASSQGVLQIRIDEANPALELFGDGGHLDVVDNRIDRLDRLTIAADVRARGGPPVSRQILLAYQLDVDRGFVFYRDVDEHLGFALRQDGDPPWQVFRSNSPLPVDQLHEVAAVFDGATVRLFVDGVDAGSFPHAQPIFLDPANGKLEIGGSIDAGTVSWNGYLRDVRVWNEALAPPFNADRKTRGMQVRALLLRGFDDASPMNRLIAPTAGFRFLSFPTDISLEGSISLSGQDYVATSSTDRLGVQVRRIMAQSVSLRFPRATASVPVLTVAETFLITDQFFNQLRALGLPADVVDPLAESFLAAGSLTEAAFNTRSDLESAIEEVLSGDQWIAHGDMLMQHAPGTPTRLRDVILTVVDGSATGTIQNESAGGRAEFMGDVSIELASFSLSAIDGLTIEKVTQLFGMTPIEPGDEYLIQKLEQQRPRGKVTAGAAGITQKFDYADVDFDDLVIRILQPVGTDRNTLRMTASSTIPQSETRTGQLRVAHAKLGVQDDALAQFRVTEPVLATLAAEGVPQAILASLADIVGELFDDAAEFEQRIRDRLSSADFQTFGAAIIERCTGIDLSNIQIDIHTAKGTPSLREAFVGLKLHRIVRLAITIRLLKVTVHDGARHDLSLKEGGVGVIKQLALAVTGTSPDDTVFDEVYDVLFNPGGRFAGAVLDTLGDISGFGVDDFGIRLETDPVHLALEGAPFSTHRRIAVSASVQMPKIGAWVRFRWREPTFDIPPWEDKTSDNKGFAERLLTGIRFKIIFAFEFELDTVTNSVKITDVKVWVVPDTLPMIEYTLAQAQELLLVYIFPFQAVKDALLAELEQQMRIALPDNWNIEKARLDFDPDGKELSISLEASENQWNSL